MVYSWVPACRRAVASGATTWGRDAAKYPWTIGFQPSYAAEGLVYGQFIARARKKAKVAVLFQNDDYGKDLLASLKLGLGQPSDAAFRWKGTPPAIDPESQLIVGLSSEGMTCKQPKGSLGASYWGYRRSGNDVVVFVESGVKGRPLTAGAIIPKPFGDG